MIVRQFLLTCLLFFWIGIISVNPAQAQNGGYDPDQGRILMDQANDAYNRKDYDEAIRLAVNATQTDPNQSDYFSSIAWFCFVGNYPKEGVRFGERAVTLDPQNWQAHINLASNAYRLHDLEKARLHYKQALSNPNIDNQHIKEAQDGLQLLRDREYEIRWSMPNENKEIVVPFVYDTPYQKTLSFSIKGGTYTFKQLADQQVIAITPLPSSNAITYTLRVRVLSRASKNGDPCDAKVSGNPKGYLAPSTRINFNDALFVDLMSHMPRTDAMTRMYYISSWLRKNLKYKLNFEAPSASETIRRGFAECREFSEVATAMARYEQIPCRVVWVLLAPDDTNVHTMKGHLVVEFYTTDMGWVPLDPQDPSSEGLLWNSYIRICHADPPCLWGPNQGLGPAGDTPNFTETRPSMLKDLSP